MFANETHLRAIVEALDEPTEFHGRSARLAYCALREAGADPEAAGYQTAKTLHAQLESAHRAIARTTSGTAVLHAVHASAYCRRVIVIRDLKHLVQLWAPIEVAA